MLVRALCGNALELGAICCQPPPDRWLSRILMWTCRGHHTVGRPRNTWDSTLQNFCRYQHLGNWRFFFLSRGKGCEPVGKCAATVRTLLHRIMNKSIWRAFMCTWRFCFHLCPSRAACGLTGFTSRHLIFNTCSQAINDKIFDQKFRSLNQLGLREMMVCLCSVRGQPVCSTERSNRTDHSVEKPDVWFGIPCDVECRQPPMRCRLAYTLGSVIPFFLAGIHKWKLATRCVGHVSLDDFFLQVRTEKFAHQISASRDQQYVNTSKTK